MDRKFIQKKQIEPSIPTFSFIKPARLRNSYVYRKDYSSTSPPILGIFRPFETSQEIVNLNSMNESKLEKQTTTNNAVSTFPRQCNQSIRFNNASAIDRAEVPWLITVFGKFGGVIKFLCSGILISDQHALTTAKCFENENGKIPLKTVSIFE